MQILKESLLDATIVIAKSSKHVSKQSGCTFSFFLFHILVTGVVVGSSQHNSSTSLNTLNTSDVCNGTLSFSLTNSNVVMFDAKTSTSPIQFLLSKRYYENGQPFKVELSTKLSETSTNPLITSFFIQAHKVNTKEIAGNFKTSISDSEVSVVGCGNVTNMDTCTVTHSHFRPRHLITLYWLPSSTQNISVRFRANVQLSTNETWKGLLSFEVVPKAKECVIANGSGYRGTVHTTASGIECQRWDSNIPHKHFTNPKHYPNDDLTSNFCRNLDNDTAPWCYTTNPSKRYEKCIIPQCVENLPRYFYPFGLSEGDSFLDKKTNLTETNEMLVTLCVKSAKLTSFKVSENGLLLFNNKREINNLTPDNFPMSPFASSLLPSTMAIAGFWTDQTRFNFTSNSSLVFYRQSVDASLLNRTTNDVKSLSAQAINKNYSIDDFNSKFAIVATWHLMKDDFRNKGNSFQVVLCGDERYTFIVLNYDHKEWSDENLAQIGYDFGNGGSINIGRYQIASNLSRYVNERSNVGVAGRWLLDVSPLRHCSGNVGKNASSLTSHRSFGAEYRLVDPSATTKRERSQSDREAIVQTQVVADPCRESPCNNGGTCATDQEGFVCDCLPGFAGRTCSNNINECLSQPCKNGGICTDLINSYSCSCTNGFTGNNCERNLESCTDGFCLNGGECISEPGGTSCICADGYEGKTCDVGYCFDGHCLSPTPCLYLVTMTTNCTCATNSKLCVAQSVNMSTIPPRKCPMQRSGNSSHGYITWKKTENGSVASVPCPVPSDRNVTRRCDASGWLAPDITNCQPLSETSLFLQQLFLGSITSENAPAILNQVAQLTALDPTVLNAYDLGNVAVILERGIEVIEVMDETTVTDVLSATSNIFLSPKHERRIAGQVSSSNARFIRNVEATTEKLNLTDTTSSHVTSSSIDVGVTKVSPAIESDVSFVLSDDLTSELSFNTNTDQSVKASITLPSEIIQNTSSSNRLLFVTFKMSELFEFTNKSSIESSNALSQLVVSDLVLSAAVGQTSVRNLSNPVVVSFTHEEASNIHCVFWQPPGPDAAEGSWSTEGCHVKKTSATTTTCECDHLTNFAVLLDIYNTQGMIGETHVAILRILTFVGCGLSIFGLTATLLSYVLFGKLKKDIPSKILASLCVALICVNLFFLVLQPSYFNSRSCVAVAALLHYFLLCSMMWMGLEALNMYIALIRVFNAYYRKYLIKLSLAGWGIPFIFVAVALGLHFAVEPSYILLENQKICWLRPKVLYGTLIAPFGLIFIFNCIIFCLVLGQLLGISSHRKLSKRESRRSKKATKGENARKFRGAVGLLALLGITWGLAFVSFGEAHLFFSYAFVVLNSTQGFWVFVFHCLLKKEISRGWQHLLQGKKLRDLRSSSKQWTRRNSDNSSASTRGSRSTPVASRTTSTASIKAEYDSGDSQLTKSSLTLDQKDDKKKSEIKQVVASSTWKKEIPLQSLAASSTGEVAVKRLVRRIPRPVISPPSVSVAVQTDPAPPQKKKIQKSLSTGTNIGEKYRIISAYEAGVELRKRNEKVVCQKQSSFNEEEKCARNSTSSSSESGIYSDNISGKSIGNIYDDRAFEGNIDVSPTETDADGFRFSNTPSYASSTSEDSPNMKLDSLENQRNQTTETKSPSSWIPPLVIKRADNATHNHTKKFLSIRTKSQPVLGRKMAEEKLTVLQLHHRDNISGEENAEDGGSEITLKNDSVIGIDDSIRMTKFRINRGSFHDTCP